MVRRRPAGLQGSAGSAACRGITCPRRALGDAGACCKCMFMHAGGAVRIVSGMCNGACREGALGARVCSGMKESDSGAGALCWCVHLSRSVGTAQQRPSQTWSPSQHPTCPAAPPTKRVAPARRAPPYHRPQGAGCSRWRRRRGCCALGAPQHAIAPTEQLGAAQQYRPGGRPPPAGPAMPPQA